MTARSVFGRVQCRRSALAACSASLWRYGCCRGPGCARFPCVCPQAPGFKIRQEAGPRPEIHVRFDRQADNWNAATGDTVHLRINYEITDKAAFALASGSQIELHVDKLSGKLALQSSNAH